MSPGHLKNVKGPARLCPSERGRATRIGIISDTHDHVRNIKRALDAFRERSVEAVLHAGDVVAPFAAKALKAGLDVPLYVVFGNNDGEREGLARVLDIAPPPREIELGGKVIILAHDLNQVPEELASSADMVVTGHTHEPLIERVIGGDTKRSSSCPRPLKINPGEAGGWFTGRATCAVVDLEALEAELCELPSP